MRFSRPRRQSNGSLDRRKRAKRRSKSVSSVRTDCGMYQEQLKSWSTSDIPREVEISYLDYHYSSYRWSV